MTRRERWQKALLDEIDWPPLGRALLAVSPFMALFLLSGSIQWLATAALVGLCTSIAKERLALAPFGVLLHGVAITTGFVLFIATSASPLLFVALCAVMAAASVWLTAEGHTLRSLGNFTFIPALYLASEVMENAASHQAIPHAAPELPYMAIGLIPVIILSASRGAMSNRSPSFLAFGPQVRLRLSHKTDYGERRAVAEACLAVACAVALAAILVEWRALDHGQWAIWSAASVVTGEAGTEHLKLRNRAAGALIGVPVGIAMGWILPHAPWVYGASVLAGLLTLIAFRRYVLGFGARCAFIAVALTVSGKSAFIAGERILNVILGGLIGLACVFTLRRLARMMASFNR